MIPLEIRLLAVGHAQITQHTSRGRWKRHCPRKQGELLSSKVKMAILEARTQGVPTPHPRS
ncbi:hypothetical protein D9R16_00435 [Corynebacterium diphtheriae]|nr:hypothetical protein BXA20_09570 [Corynebacterium diphtheriae]RLP17829.1 hypothetical protein D9R16_00435 [Corynebacterium diphtheriae]